MREVGGRRGQLALLLLLLCGVLAGVIYAEATVSLAPASPAVERAPAASQPNPTFSMPPLASYAETTARPLFSPSRRPLPAAGPASEASAFTLVGIIISPSERHALLRHGRPPQVDRVAEGQTIDGWTVKAIDPDRVVLSRGGSEAEITPPVAGSSGNPFARFVPRANSVLPLPQAAPIRALPPPVIYPSRATER